MCTFPVVDAGQIVTMLQTRGEANAYDRVVNIPYEEYAKLVEETKEHGRASSSS